MTQGIRYTITNDSITVIDGPRLVTVPRTAINFSNLKDALLAEDWDRSRQHLTPGLSLETWARGRFSLDGNSVLFDGRHLPAEINDRIVQMAAAGESPEPLFRFWERLQLNPSARSVSQLWNFLALCGIPLTSDGHFLAYKGIRSDMRDKRTGQIDNSPGQVIRVQRNQVSDDPDEPCHFGLHVGSLEYATDFGEQVVIAKVDPRDVVCVPNDHSYQKMRVCEYRVVGFATGEHMPSTTISDDDRPDDDYDEEECEDCAATPAEPILPDSINRRGTKNKVFIKMDGLAPHELESCSLENLRKYASKHLLLVGASRIRGGKAALINAIVDRRGH